MRLLPFAHYEPGNWKGQRRRISSRPSQLRGLAVLAQRCGLGHGTWWVVTPPGNRVRGRSPWNNLVSTRLSGPRNLPDQDGIDQKDESESRKGQALHMDRNHTDGWRTSPICGVVGSL